MLKEEYLNHGEFMNSIRTSYPQCSHLLVVDFEATCGPGIPKGGIEIIEVGALLCSFELNTFETTELPTYHRLVKPQLHPKITPFCTRLTGIRQKDVRKAPLFVDMIVEWKDFLLQHNCRPQDVLFGSWSKFDAKQIRLECSRNQCDLPFAAYIDLQNMFKQTQQHKSVQSVKKALISVELEFDGQEHSALSDARNTTRLVMHSNW